MIRPLYRKPLTGGEIAIQTPDFTDYKTTQKGMRILIGSGWYPDVYFTHPMPFTKVFSTIREVNVQDTRESKFLADALLAIGFPFQTWDGQEE